MWKTVVKTYVELFQQYLKDHPGSIISYGTFFFFSFKPLYIHHASTKDMIMCCCKVHLPTHWSIRAFIRCMEKQEILLPIPDYFTFFPFLYIDCPRDDSTHILWECYPVKKNLCAHITEKWGQLKEMASFTDALLPEITYHQNMLKLYRSSIKMFYQLFPAVHLDIDFSENLTIEVKFEPLSLHWVKQQITVHSGIVNVNVEKSYHPYVSDSRVHDQAFVKLAMIAML